MLLVEQQNELFVLENSDEAITKNPQKSSFWVLEKHVSNLESEQFEYQMALPAFWSLHVKKPATKVKCTVITMKHFDRIH